MNIVWGAGGVLAEKCVCVCVWLRSEEHTSELQSPVASSYAVVCLKKKTETPHGEAGAAGVEAAAAGEDEAWRLLSGERERERERERDLDLLLRRRTHTWRVRVCVCD